MLWESDSTAKGTMHEVTDVRVGHGEAPSWRGSADRLTDSLAVNVGNAAAVRPD